MNFLFASDSFKGSLSSQKINEILTKTAKRHFPDCTTVSVLTADGGEGTQEAVLFGTGGCEVFTEVHDPLGRKIRTSYGKINETSAIVEMAKASGLPLLSENERNPLKTSSYGTGELILKAIEDGAEDITVAIGGSATNDGGIGMLSALGVRFLDKDGNILLGKGEDLEKICDIDISKIDPKVIDAKFTVMCDVNNPLLGEDGATMVFSAQKGADSEIKARLEKGMENYAKVAREKHRKDLNAVTGGGAAGGMGAALSEFLSAEMKSGIDTLLDLIGFDALLDKSDIVITGEGRMDAQSVCGKVASGIGKRAKTKGVPAFAIVGSMGDGAEKIYDVGISSIVPTVNRPMSLDDAIKDAEILYENAAERLLRIIKTVQNITKL